MRPNGGEWVDWDGGKGEDRQGGCTGDLIAFEIMQDI